jgi:hypothetical protein
MDTVSVTANELNVLLENILLYTDKKANHLREVLFIFTSQGIQAFACDEYVAITDIVNVDCGVSSREFSLSIEDVEAFLAWVKEDKKTVHKTLLELKFKHTVMTGHSNDYDTTFQASYLKPLWDNWNIVLELLSDEYEELPNTRFNLNPNRLAKLDRLKADKEAPVAFRWVDIRGRMTLQFKKGRTVTGVFQPIDDKYVKEEFLWTNLEGPTQQKLLGHTEASPNSASTESVESFTD